MEETFRTVEGFEDYQVSNLGRIITNKKGEPTFLKPQTDAMGYQHVRLYPDDYRFGSYEKTNFKKPKLYKVHKLVAETFIPRVETGETLNVNHKDGDKTNNTAENLEWLSHGDNIRHSWDIGLRTNSAEKAALKRYKPAMITYPDGTVHYYESRKHMCLDLDIRPGTILLQFKAVKPITKGRLKGCIIEDCPNLSEGITFKEVDNLEEKLKHYAKFQEYMREKSRERREKNRKK